eukprot:Polyplicarium_translucidae@DN952_c0_g1_i1.p1
MLQVFTSCATPRRFREKSSLMSLVGVSTFASSPPDTSPQCFSSFTAEGAEACLDLALENWDIVVAADRAIAEYAHRRHPYYRSSSLDCARLAGWVASIIAMRPRLTSDRLGHVIQRLLFPLSELPENPDGCRAVHSLAVQLLASPDSERHAEGARLVLSVTNSFTPLLTRCVIPFPLEAACGAPLLECAVSHAETEAKLRGLRALRGVADFVPLAASISGGEFLAAAAGALLPAARLALGAVSDGVRDTGGTAEVSRPPAMGQPVLRFLTTSACIPIWRRWGVEGGGALLWDLLRLQTSPSFSACVEILSYGLLALGRDLAAPALRTAVAAIAAAHATPRKPFFPFSKSRALHAWQEQMLSAEGDLKRIRRCLKTWQNQGRREVKGLGQ